MEKTNVFDQVLELKEKFNEFFQHRKKVIALENYSVDTKFKHRTYLLLVKECLKEGFLDEEEAGFLDHMLNKYQVNYLDWFHKTKWLKAQMSDRMAQEMKKRPVQMVIDFDRLPKTPVHVPLALIAYQSAQVAARI